MSGKATEQTDSMLGPTSVRDWSRSLAHPGPNDRVDGQRSFDVNRLLRLLHVRDRVLDDRWPRCLVGPELRCVDDFPGDPRPPAAKRSP